MYIDNMYSKFLLQTFLLACSCIFQSDTYDPLKAADYFELFVANYNKNYTDPLEKTKRYHIFKDNLEEINNKNKSNDTAVYRINKFSDLSTNELISKYTGLNVPGETANFCKIVVLDQPPGKGPLNFDWRQQNKVTPIKNQGACGACWAFATLASIESQYAIRNNVHLDLSEQQMIDCDYVDMGCYGGLLHTAFEQMIQMGGVEEERQYPYEGVNNNCRLKSDERFVVKVKGCYRYLVMREEKLKDLLRAVGPLPMAIDASSIFNYYRGVINYCGNNGLNHAVLLVGYGVENGVPFWTFKNTWGDDWGEDGYFRVRQNVDACGMLNELTSSAVIE
ncbi:cathepsin [Euproctis pseudoconspersa nucleopolyhedrovirus]|uniref:Viral cathepsin n=1 Tax=Euproctis pseudoconspersa nucleopolyhedrovirus TaxID=307467 RepID=C3TWW7_9ABAC|nr:cathepsin [Euproctis pseudoconspersa nucleopolyhedrovirus]ACO53509.1 cathepsin [Euproctis pseudoconspersa nucleopolyhedrovirus]QUJ09249.1 cathepsin [Gynaephora ruoergensis nucleopolyhedrovirus]